MLKRQSLEFDIKWFMEPPSLVPFPLLVTKTWGSNGNCYDKAGVLLFIFRDKCEFLKPLFVFLSSASTHSLLFLDKFKVPFSICSHCVVFCAKYYCDLPGNFSFSAAVVIASFRVRASPSTNVDLERRRM